MKATIRLSRCKEIISLFNGAVPLSVHLKNYFSKHKEMGSTDRKKCRELIYNYFRLGKALSNEPVEMRILCGNYIFNTEADEVMHHLESIHSGFDLTRLDEPPFKKFQTACIIFPAIKETEMFPFFDQLTNRINHLDWFQSFFIKPLVWIRVRKHALMQVKAEFDKLQLKYIQAPDNSDTLGFEAAVKISETQAFSNGLIEIQDLSSQQTLKFLTPKDKKESWWDCCAGSGGKSLLLLDNYPEISLTVSDSRLTIIQQLTERFKKAGLNPFQSFVADLTHPLNTGILFDAILVDAPCSGSGTWNRTPEMLSFFKNEFIIPFANRQKLILKNILPSLKAGGKIIYITCSVFIAENEEVVEDICLSEGLQCESMEIIPGFQRRADTLFIAVLRRI